MKNVWRKVLGMAGKEERKIDRKKMSGRLGRTRKRRNDLIKRSRLGRKNVSSRYERK